MSETRIGQWTIRVLARFPDRDPRARLSHPTRGSVEGPATLLRELAIADAAHGLDLHPDDVVVCEACGAVDEPMAMRAWDDGVYTCEGECVNAMKRRVG